MRTNRIKLGDSYGVRIPKELFDQAGLGKSFHVVVSKNCIELRRYKNPRYGWATASRKAVRKHGNRLSEEDIEWLNAPMGPPADSGSRRRSKRRKSA